MKNLFLGLCGIIVVLCIRESLTAAVNKVGSGRSGVLETTEWNYDKPSSWPAFCGTGSTLQSPIHIPQSVHCNNSAKGVMFSNAFTESRNFLVHNTGHSVSFDVPTGESALVVTTKENREPYKVDSFHLHWGGPHSVRNGRGSEHTIGTEKTVLEIHIVTHDTKFASLDLAKAHVGDTLVIGILYKIGHHNAELDQVLEKVDKVKAVNASTTAQLKLGDFLPKNHKFYFYPGSFTTPNCESAVSWHLFKDIQHVSAAQMDRFRHVVGENFDSNVGNFRPVQDPKGRSIVCNP